MPTRGQVSVFRIDGLDEDAIWEIGSDVGMKREQTLYARGETKAHDASFKGSKPDFLFRRIFKSPTGPSEADSTSGTTPATLVALLF